MSVRRLAKDQPETFAFTPEMDQLADWWIAKYPKGRQRSAVIPLLWLAQKQEGWVSEPAIGHVADRLGMQRIRVLEVATFYTMFQLEPVGRAGLIQVCGTTPCMLRGAQALMATCARVIGPKDKLSADGLFTWQEVECLGACVNAPMAQINDRYVEDLTPEALEGVIEDLRHGRPLKEGSAAGRRSSEPLGGARTLQDPALYDGSAARPIPVLPGAPEREPA
jgi:NADH-quinone oxidoreductase subunit E